MNRKLILACMIGGWLWTGSLWAQKQTSSSLLDREEELASQAERVLKHVGAFLEDKLTAKELASDLASKFSLEFQLHEFRPNVRPGHLLIEKRDPDVDSKRETPVSLTLAEFKKLLAGKVLRTKFKIIEVRTDPKATNAFSTVQLAALFLKSETGYREINTQWTADWETDGKTAKLTILGGDLNNETRLDASSLAFEDKTSELLKLDETSSSSIQGGVHQWLQRLELTMEPEFFALSGLSVADVTGDGLEDVYVCQLGGLPNLLLVQQHDGSFKNLAPDVGLDFYDNTTCALFVDFDNDGDQDLVIATSSGIGFFEQLATGKFQLKRLESGIRYTYSLCAADYDQDGLVDVYACHYYGSRSDRENASTVQGSLPVPHPVFDANNGGRNVLFQNRGSLSFVDVTKSVGLDVNNSRFSYAAIWEDWDNDGDQDLYVANDFGQNNLYRNDRGKFSDVTKSWNLDRREFSMGVTAGDYDGNGRMDIHVCNMFSSAGSRVSRQSAFKSGQSEPIKEIFQLLSRGNSLALNQPDGTFVDGSVDAGITVGRWSWASVSPDINNDGYEDLLVANGFVTGQDLDDL